MKTIYDIFKELDINYEFYEHPPFFTCEESAAWYEENLELDSGESKNLFLRDRKGTQHFLVVIESTKRLDLKMLAKDLDESKLSFASERRLKEVLNLKPGSVSPFALTYKNAKNVRVVFDTDLLKNDKLHYHPPGRNDQTVVLSTAELKRFLEWTGNYVTYMEL
jgi:Ala-tRNA(Pro) deacylase